MFGSPVAGVGSVNNLPTAVVASSSNPAVQPTATATLTRAQAEDVQRSLSTVLSTKIDKLCPGEFTLVAGNDDIFTNWADDFLTNRNLFASQGKPITIEIGYHNTSKRAMLPDWDAIPFKGLVTSTNRRSFFGRGIYLGNNPHAFRSYGQVGMIVLYVKGETKWCYNNEEDLGNNQVVDTFTGNKVQRLQRGPTSPYFDEIVLRNRHQALPLIQYNNEWTNNADLMWQVHLLVHEWVESMSGMQFPTTIPTQIKPHFFDIFFEHRLSKRFPWHHCGMPTNVRFGVQQPANTNFAFAGGSNPNQQTISPFPAISLFGSGPAPAASLFGPTSTPTASLAVAQFNIQQPVQNQPTNFFGSFPPPQAFGAAPSLFGAAPQALGAAPFPSVSSGASLSGQPTSLFGPAPGLFGPSTFPPATSGAPSLFGPAPNAKAFASSTQANFGSFSTVPAVATKELLTTEYCQPILLKREKKTNHSSSVLPPKDAGECPICFDPLDKTNAVVKVNLCKHLFHKKCLNQAFKVCKTKQCPVCRAPLGEPTGSCPRGSMKVWRRTDQPCAGFESYSTLCIRYSIEPGVESGRAFSGTERKAYVPDTEDGRRLLKRLQYAFRRGLTFSVGDSMSSGRSGVVCWASIHHKTSRNGGTVTHGWPDNKYFDNCNGELDALGVPSASML